MLPALLAIQLTSKGDLQAQKMLSDIRQSFPTELIFVTWLLQANRLGFIGPALCTIRAETGSVCEMVCHVLVRYAKKFHAADPVILLATDRTIAEIRKTMTW